MKRRYTPNMEPSVLTSLIMTGMSYKAIGQTLGCSTTSARNVCHKFMNGLGYHTRILFMAAEFHKAQAMLRRRARTKRMPSNQGNCRDE